MIHFIWPIALVVLSNVVYQICAKGVTENVNSFVSLFVTYMVSAVVSLLLYFLIRPQGSLVKELTKLNWVPFVFGIVLVGLELGWIYAYRAGWQVSIGTIVQSSFLAIILLFVGFFLYNEALTWNKIAGTIICLIGLLFINLK